MNQKNEAFAEVEQQKICVCVCARDGLLVCNAITTTRYLFGCDPLVSFNIINMSHHMNVKRVNDKAILFRFVTNFAIEKFMGSLLKLDARIICNG